MSDMSLPSSVRVSSFAGCLQCRRPPQQVINHRLGLCLKLAEESLNLGRTRPPLGPTPRTGCAAARACAVQRLAAARHLTARRLPRHDAAARREPLLGALLLEELR